MPRSSANPRAAASTCNARGRLRTSARTRLRRAAATAASYAVVSSLWRARSSRANARSSSVATCSARSWRARSRTSVATLTSEYIGPLSGRAAGPRDPDRQDDAGKGKKSNAHPEQPPVDPAAVAAARLGRVLQLDQRIVAELRRGSLVDVLADAQCGHALPAVGGPVLVDRTGLFAARRAHLQSGHLVLGLADDLHGALVG